MRKLLWTNCDYPHEIILAEVRVIRPERWQFSAEKIITIWQEFHDIVRCLHGVCTFYVLVWPQLPLLLLFLWCFNKSVIMRSKFVTCPRKIDPVSTGSDEVEWIPVALHLCDLMRRRREKILIAQKVKVKPIIIIQNLV